MATEIFVRSSTPLQCESASIKGNYWFIRLEKRASPPEKIGVFYEAWGRGKDLALSREGTIGASVEIKDASGWSSVQLNVSWLEKNSYVINGEAIKTIKVKEFEETILKKRLMLLTQFPSPFPRSVKEYLAAEESTAKVTEEGSPEKDTAPRSIKDLMESRQRKSDW